MRRSFLWWLPAAFALVSSPLSGALAQQVRPRILVILDTSGSMLADFPGWDTFGDGSADYPGLDTSGDGLPADSRLFIAKSLPFFLELAHPDVSKGVGLQFVADRLGFTRGQTVAFGDGENDLELVDWAGYAVAVENAHPVVKARADFVCPSAEEEGVAQVIEAFLAQ